MNFQSLEKEETDFQAASFFELSLENPCSQFSSLSCSISHYKSCLSGQAVCLPNGPNFFELSGIQMLSDGLRVENLFLHDEWEISINLHNQLAYYNAVIFRVREVKSNKAHVLGPCSICALVICLFSYFRRKSSTSE